MTDDREHITSSSITERSVRPERSGADGRCRSEIFTVDLAGMLIMVGAGGADRAVRSVRSVRTVRAVRRAVRSVRAVRFGKTKAWSKFWSLVELKMLSRVKNG